MPISKSTFKKVLKQAFASSGFTSAFERDLTFNLVRDNDTRIISTQLLVSTKINPTKHGSHNGNETHGIGVFKFSLPPLELKPDYIIMAFENTITGNAEFLVIEYDDLIQRLTKRNRVNANTAEVWFWLMPDRCVFETTNISIEGEWYYLSKGQGRMADDSDMDYSKYLNNWNSIKPLKQ